MKLRKATVFIAVALLSLFATSCGGGGGGGGRGGGGGDDDLDYLYVYTDDSGYDHPFGGMRDGYYISEPIVLSAHWMSCDTYWIDLSADGYWDGRCLIDDYIGVRRYFIEEGEIVFLIWQDSSWNIIDRFYLSDDHTSFEDSSGNRRFTYRATPPNPHNEYRD